MADAETMQELYTVTGMNSWLTPLSSLASTSDPFSIRSFTVSSLPSLAAMCRKFPWWTDRKITKLDSLDWLMWSHYCTLNIHEGRKDFWSGPAVMKGTEVPNPRRSSACDCTCVLSRNRSRDSLLLAMRILFCFCLCKVCSRVSDAFWKACGTYLWLS